MALHILLADDEREFVETLAERLGLRGHHVRVVYDGVSALAEMEKELPQVMVIDWMMPGLSGEEVLRKVKASHAGLPVIVLTGHQAVDDNGQDPVAGAFMCLTKPVAFATLLDAITAAALSSGEVRS